MCDIQGGEPKDTSAVKTIPLTEAVGMVLAHDITEIRDEFKGRAFKKGHIVRDEDICHLQRLGKERLFVLSLSGDEMHEDDAAHALAMSLMGEGVCLGGEPKEGKINLTARHNGLLKIHKDALLRFNMIGDVMCATLHDNTVVKKGQVIGGTRAIPLVVKRQVIEQAVAVAGKGRDAGGVIRIKQMRKPKAGVVITGSEVYLGRIRDAFAPIIKKKIQEVDGEIVGICYAPDEEAAIELRLRELIHDGADLLITTGGMSVDPDDVTRFAIRNLGATDITYGSAVLPGAMFLIAYIEKTQGARSIEQNKNEDTHCPIPHALIPVLGIPACGMYHKTTIFDLMLPRVLAGETIGRRELAELGHGGLCLNCPECRYPLCPFGK